MESSGSPPRRRGKGYREFGIDISDRITPAQAGKSVAPRQKRSALWDHPRVGGEKYSRPSYSRISMGSPPRGRGKDSGTVHGCGQLRITPAWAGKRCSSGRCCMRQRDHPRVGGEKTENITPSIYEQGSPPRGRGKVQASDSGHFADGITPAWAGKRSERCAHENCSEDHPRVGGEKHRTGNPADHRAGSPPHRRGKPVKIILWHSCQGSPPHRRGKAGENHLVAQLPGITPA